MRELVFASLIALCVGAVPAFAEDAADISLEAGEMAVAVSEETPKDAALERAKANLKRKLASEKKLAAKAERIHDRAIGRISSGKLAKAAEDVKQLKKLRRKAIRICRNAWTIRLKHPELKKTYRKILRKRNLAIDAFEDAEERLGAAKERISSRAAAANRLRANGVIYSGGWRYTYYSQKVLPGYGLSIPGRHVGAAGMVMDGSGRVCVASSSHSMGSVISTPFGTAKVYDTGCPYGTIDIYVNW